VQSSAVTVNHHRSQPPPLVVEPAWLAHRRHELDLRILDVRDRESYQAGHLPGAIWLDRNALSQQRGDGSVTLIAAEPFAALMGRLGVDGASTVLVYDDVWGMHGARVVWALRRYGHGAAALLSGGAEGWAAAGLPLTRGTTLAFPRRFVPISDERQRAETSWVQARTGDRSLLLLDVRGHHEYAAGHLLNARHWEWSNGTPTGSRAALRPADELRAELRACGITPERRIVTYCSSGMRAAHTYLLLRSLGYPDVRVLDGQWRGLVRQSVDLAL
jgi:thiosulfate/3-mercaptopyruvate sulfurtransferase